MILLIVIVGISSGLFYFIVSPISEAVGGAGKIVLVVFLLILFMILAGLIARGKS